MQTQPVANDIGFNGNVYKINKLSKNPQICFDKVFANLQQLLDKKPYDLYIRQNYSNGNIEFIAAKSKEELENKDSIVGISNVSKYSKYYKAAKEAMLKYNAIQTELNKKQYEKTLKQEEIEEIVDTICYYLLDLPSIILTDLIIDPAKELIKYCKNKI